MLFSKFKIIFSVKEVEHSEMKVTWNHHRIYQRLPIVYISKCLAFPSVLDLLTSHWQLKIRNPEILKFCFPPLVFPSQKTCLPLLIQYSCGAINIPDCSQLSFLPSSESTDASATVLYLSSFSFRLICGTCQVMRCFLAAQENANYRTTDVVCPLK